MQFCRIHKFKGEKKHLTFAKSYRNLGIFTKFFMMAHLMYFILRSLYCYFSDNFIVKLDYRNKYVKVAMI